MSNSLAVAAVTQTLRHLLDGPVGVAVSGAHATVQRPEEVNPATAGMNIFLYQVAPNPAWRNEDLPTRPEDGQGVLQRPRAAIDLHYLFTFHGSEAGFEPQRILGAAVRTLHASPVLSRTRVRNAVNAVATLAASDLDGDVDLVRITPLPLSLEELSKLWSVFFKTNYSLSMAYQASVVLIESTETPRPPIPVAGHRVVVVPSFGPVLEKLSARASAAGSPEVSDVPVILTDTLILEGRGLRGPAATRVRIGHAEFTPANVHAERIEIDLNTELPAGERRAGVKAVQVLHDLDFGTPADPHRGFESNALPFMLVPTITVNAGATNAAQVVVNVSPQVIKDQRAVLLLSQTPAPPSGTPARAFAFPRKVPATGSSLTIPISGVPTGSYIVRLQLDGAESGIDIDAATGRFKDTPKAAIP